MQLEVRNTDMLTFEGDGLVVPSICEGLMLEGIAARVKEAAGDDVEQQVHAHAPIAVGAALVTSSGALSVQHLIHAPVVEEPGLRVGVENIRRAVRASLLAATKYELATIAIPGFGYGENGVSHEETARAIIDEVSGYKGGALPEMVVLIDEDREMFEAFVAQAGTGK